MKRIVLISLAAVLFGACQSPPPAPSETQTVIDQVLHDAINNRTPEKPPAAVERALLPPLGAELPHGKAAPAEPRFNLSVNKAPASEVFTALAADTHYSMIVHPEVGGTISINLKDVTLVEALDTIRDAYGYEYKIEGTRVFIEPITMQSHIYQVNYLMSRRLGRTETRVASGTISGQLNTGVQMAAPAPTQTTSANGMPGFSASGLGDGSAISTMSLTDFWAELADSIKAIIGADGGRSVVVSPQSSIIVVRALPREQREVEAFLRASQLSIERQVMLEAKVVDVILSDAHQTGINWTALTSQMNHFASVGADPTRINIPGSIGNQYGIANGSIVTQVDPTTTPPTVTPTVLGQLINAPVPAAGSALLGMALTTHNFEALLSFLDTQGKTHVLSSPRVAAVNNQTAVLRVGTDDFYVTNITTTTTAVGTTSVTTPSITVQPFFSGISLDVTPQIDEQNNIILHIRPSVSVVSQQNLVVNLGTLGSYTLPLASSNINETDTIVRARDGNMVVIGGLMQQTESDDVAKVPGVGDIPIAGNLFKQTSKSLVKRELVFLIRPTVIDSDRKVTQDLEETRERLHSLEPPREIKLSGKLDDAVH
jgi:MSHA biogenesis protein MshL